MKPTLLLLAAGIGSRYGSLKQIDQVGPSGETIMDYSIYDAIRAGFGKVVFVIRKSIEAEFRATFSGKFQDKIEVDYVLQELDNVPEGITYNPERQKPWGTAHAVLVAADAIKEPFAALNADDFYGKEAFEVLANFLNQQSATDSAYAMVGYQLGNTLSDHGTVSRGECVANAEDFFESVTERTKIERQQGQIYFMNEAEKVPLADETIVSMNMWGFTPTYFEYARKHFEEFIAENRDQLRAELYIPTVISRLIDREQANVKVLESSAKWFGVTYKEDKPIVISKIKELVDKGVYPENLWA